MKALLPKSKNKEVARATRRLKGQSHRLDLRRILVPIDFSSGSKKAIQYAVALAEDYESKVFLLHVFPDHQASRKTLEQTKVQIRKLTEEISKVPSVLIVIKVGNVIPKIIEAARDEMVDLIVMSRRSDGGTPALFPAGTAEKIAHQAPCPLLLVPEHERDFTNQRPHVPFNRPRLD